MPGVLAALPPRAGALVSPESRAPEPPARARARATPAAPALGQPVAPVLGQPWRLRLRGSLRLRFWRSRGRRLECRRGFGRRVTGFGRRCRGLTGTLPRIEGDKPRRLRWAADRRLALDRRSGVGFCLGWRRPGFGLGWCPVAKQPGIAAPQRSEQPHDDLLERVPGDSRMAHASVCVLDQQRVDPARQRRVDRRVHIDQGGDALVDVAHQHDHWRLRVVKRRPPHQQLVRQHPQRVQIGPGANVARHGLLGGHVGGRPDSHTGGSHLPGPGLLSGPCDPVIGELHPSVSRHHDVLGLQVTVHDAGRLRVCQRRQHALQYARDPSQRQAPHVLAQRAARDVLHRDVRRASVLEVLMHGDDVRVVERAGEPRLAQEPVREVR